MCSVFEPQVVQAVVKEAVNPNNLKPGEIRPIKRTGRDGQTFIDWIGQHSFVREMTRPGRRVVSFTTDRGKFDAIRSKWM